MRLDKMRTPKENKHPSNEEKAYYYLSKLCSKTYQPVSEMPSSSEEWNVFASLEQPQMKKPASDPQHEKAIRDLEAKLQKTFKAGVNEKKVIEIILNKIESKKKEGQFLQAKEKIAYTKDLNQRHSFLIQQLTRQLKKYKKRHASTALKDKENIDQNSTLKGLEKYSLFPKKEYKLSSRARALSLTEQSTESFKDKDIKRPENEITKRNISKNHIRPPKELSRPSP